MPDQEFSILQIRLLFKCSAKPVSKSQLANFALYRHSSHAERQAALDGLIQAGLLTAKALPKEGANKIPTFYFISDKGLQWVEEYRRNYPA